MESTTQPKGLTIPTAAVIGIVVVIGTLFHTWLHQRVHGVYNATQVGLAFFLVINVMIAWWEIALFVCQDQIRSEYEAIKEPYRGREMTRIAEVFARPIPLFRVLSFSQWTTIWSSYSLFDPGYSDRRSYGYNIDVGNGFTTLIPATLFAFGMTLDLMPARVLGIIGVIIFWQMFYGTAVYFFQFFNNGRHKGHSLRDLLLFVGITNLMWFIFPIWGLSTSVRLILDGSYSLFL
ncbi:MAG: hypothetical protein JRG67_02640 [Deltaproteobacteria bacterium]|jgi:hypothetical protein|nr:hypothetical protein [Deltaproteobacteria bacterium]MBW1874567.1 hypothetical protein [Deltaproteobacteria bacterium]MBW2209932.1 hypothetical protein [Deltaproteobacteria bacterium]MBW2213013.1 hypothetical protein [Deltaproteobacteria bacterium]MBW2380884.1 hypothetical protein [Deltaproteobacteria bacterium]